MPFPRSSGLLLHPTSLPSPFGIGDLGLQAYQFIEFLAQSAQQYWQILPLGPIGYGNSPYDSYSAMAGNPLLISPEQLQKQGLLKDEDFANLPEFPLDSVDYDQVIQTKMPLLYQACDRFRANASPQQHQKFTEFCQAKASWLEDYALFMAVHDAFDQSSWHTWERDIAMAQPKAVEYWRQKLQDEIYFYKYLQFEFFCQWSALKQYANHHQIQIIGDIPIYVAHDSADVWAHREIFAIDHETGEPTLMAGVPPDYFSATGQLWGNPVYNWKQLEADNFRWWIQRFQTILEYVDIVRIDHFRGFEAYWQVKQGETTAITGEWVKAPGKEFFEVLQDKLGNLPIIAEDLGIITPEVEALRSRFQFPGMKILQFAFSGGSSNPYLPFNYVRNCVVYTGTHDNDTTVGWFKKLSAEDKQIIINYCGPVSEEGIHWDLIRLALSSIANQAIIPVQDILGLDTDARMNFPSTVEGNWQWRYRPNALSEELANRLKILTHTYGRAPVSSDY
ncbi:MAG: 4-alpha-glucanotransferase [Moorea sp. SIO4A1]|uniref:4-alpha-glucanotransferase n=1 Tax=Moorena sp. SIO4A1 TaxID=2607835 RepID=UPI00144AFDC7|nr:4-alpha-glucanotransferase [Moorena sp. SIO4A1]NEQ59511.1 4-alpha-glucanotransferase [Moorena sp. SIO4A1]